MHVVVLFNNAVAPETDFEMPYTGWSCEGDNLQLRCPADYIIDVQYAFYGRNDMSTCVVSQLNNTASCSVDSAFTTVSTMCNGHQECDIASAVTTFATVQTDPCPQTSKFFKISFVCKRELLF